MRDVNLPNVNKAYIDAVLSLPNLAAARGDPVIIPNDLLSAHQAGITEYVIAGAAFRTFYFSVGATAETNNVAEDYDTEIITEDAVIQGVRKLFKLGRAINVHRGAPGCLSTAFGSLASAMDQWNAAVRTEENSLRALAERTARQTAKAASEEREKPVKDMLIAAGYLKRNERLLRKTLCTMFSNNMEMVQKLGLSMTASRGAMISALLTLLN